MLLTVLIPTYNRKKQLSNTLDALEKQSNCNFNIVISDNHSDYDIDEILDGRNTEFINRIVVYRRKHNIGADGNIANLFTLCQTKWAWFLSDDDFVRLDAVEKILKEINDDPDAGAFNFSIISFSQFEHKRRDVSLAEFINFYYPMHKQLHGDLIYLANKVFNIERIQACIGYIFKYNYTKVSTIVLIYKILEYGIPYCTVNEKIVEYDMNSKHSWSFGEVVLGTRTLMDIPFKLDLSYHKKLIIISAFDWKFAINSYFFPNKTQQYPNFLDQLYHGLYKYILPFPKRVVFKILSVLAQYQWGIKAVRMAKKGK